jgi:NADP-dependent 3-hydroxy acid dehydrogenase YdfG
MRGAWERDLQGKVAWITGAGTGIGEAAATALGRAGMRVALSGRRPEPLEEVHRRVSDSIVMPLDVADKRAVLAARDEILAKWGRVDVLVNSAGLNVRNRNWHNVTLEDWDLVIRADLDGEGGVADDDRAARRLDRQRVLVGRQVHERADGPRLQRR